MENWTEVTRPGGGGVSHHVTYKLVLYDGRILRTRISRPINKSGTYGPSVWAHILRDQLEVNADQFWNCVKNKVLPPRPQAPSLRQNMIPVALLKELTSRAGYTERDVAEMSREEAVIALAEYYKKLAP